MALRAKTPSSWRGFPAGGRGRAFMVRPCPPAGKPPRRMASWPSWPRRRFPRGRAWPPGGLRLGPRGLGVALLGGHGWRGGVLACGGFLIIYFLFILLLSFLFILFNILLLRFSSSGLREDGNPPGVGRGSLSGAGGNLKGQEEVQKFLNNFFGKRSPGQITL